MPPIQPEHNAEERELINLLKQSLFRDQQALDNLYQNSDAGDWTLEAAQAVAAALLHMGQARTSFEKAHALLAIDPSNDEDE